MIGWIQGFPLWRKALWGLSVLLGTLGAVLLLMRRSLAPTLLWGAAILMVVGFVGHDLLLADGVKYYGQVGMISSTILNVLAILLAWHASIAARGRAFKR